MQRGPGRRAGGPGFLGRWLRKSKGSRASARPGQAQGVGERWGIQSRGSHVCGGRGSSRHPHPSPTPSHPSPPLPHPSLPPPPGRWWKDAGRGMTGRTDRQTHGDTASQGKCGGGGGVGVRQTDKDGVLRRLVDRWGEGGPRKRMDRLRAWGGKDRQTAGESGPVRGEDRQRTRRDRWTPEGRRGRRSPRGRGQAEGARGGGRSGEAEAGRAAVFVELSAAVEL